MFNGIVIRDADLLGYNLYLLLLDIFYQFLDGWNSLDMRGVFELQLVSLDGVVDSIGLTFVV